MKTKKLLSMAMILIISLLTFNVKAQTQAVCLSHSSSVHSNGSPFLYNSLFTLADFNGDGIHDSAVVYNNSTLDIVSVFIGNANGIYNSSVDFQLASGSRPSSIVSADFNGDGKIDLATTNENNGTASILIGNGLGNFGAPINFNEDQIGSSSFLCSDFNGDGKPDLAATNTFFGGTDTTFLLNTTIFINITAIPHDTVCNGISVTLTASGATSYVWSGGIINGTAFTPLSTLTYTVTGTGTISGCTSSNTAIKKITVLPKPTGIITTKNESSSLFCDGSIKATLAPGITWKDSTLSIIDSIVSLCPGIYTSTLTDLNGCTNTIKDTVHAGPLPPTPPICHVSVDSTHTHNIVIWEKTNLNLIPIDSFVIYREISTNNYQQIGVVSKDSMTTFKDLVADPATTGYRYKIKSKNNHGVSSPLSDYHNTIYLTSTGGNFSWTPYQIENSSTAVSNYNVYRDDNSTGNFQVIGSTTGSQFGYTDVNFASFPNASYYVEAAMSTCHPTRSMLTGSTSNVKRFFITTGIQQIKNTSIKVFPNPATNFINVTGITDNTKVRVFDMVGNLIFEKEAEGNTIINTDQFASGMYSVSIENKEGVSNNRIVINH